MLLRLNGWQRLYIVLSVVYLFVLAFLASSDFPTAGDYEGQRLERSIKLVEQYLQNQGKDEKLWPTGLTANQLLFGDQELLTKLHHEFKDRVDFSKVEKEYRSGLIIVRVKFVLNAIGLVWLTPVVGIYLSFLGVIKVAKWVISGF